MPPKGKDKKGKKEKKVEEPPPPKIKDEPLLKMERALESTVDKDAPMRVLSYAVRAVQVDLSLTPR